MIIKKRVISNRKKRYYATKINALTLLHKLPYHLSLINFIRGSFLLFLIRLHLVKKKKKIFNGNQKLTSPFNK